MTTDSSNRRRFEVALSFPGEHRNYVEEVAECLAMSFDKERVLYDKYHEVEFARLDLDVYLPKLYLKDSELIVIFLCSEYADKHWCKLEWRYIRQLITSVEGQRIMLVSFGEPGDLSDIGILPGDGYINLHSLTPKLAADKIIKRISINQGVTDSTKQTQKVLNIKNDLCNEFHGRQHVELLNYFSTNWLFKGSAVAILQGLPGCGKSQLARSIAARAPRSLNLIEPQTDTHDPSLYLLIEIAESLASEGIPDLLVEFNKGANGDLFNALLTVLRREQVLIIIDEFQRLFSDKDTFPPVGWQRLIEKLNNSNRPAGRLLIISNRAIKKSPWCENCISKELKGLTDSEAANFLKEILESKDLSSKVPSERVVEICHRLGGNPRALTTLASSLFYESLEDLLSLAPDLFKVGDVKLDHDLVEDFERELIERTLPHMDADLLKFMRYIAVHRRPFKKEAFSAFPASSIQHKTSRKQLIERFLLVNTTAGDTMHPLAREISVTRLRDVKDEWVLAHDLAANYHFRHFKAVQMKGAERCISSYSELRHHLFEAERIDELYHASKKLAQFILSQISKPAQSQIPVNVATLEERIALISALPEGQRPKGLEYHLALCLKHRNTGDDYQTALTCVRRAVGPNIYYAAWLLLIELEYSLNGVDAMINAQKEALMHLGSGSNAFAIYHLCANLLSKNNKLDAAINLLEKGISTPGVKCLAPLINQCSKYMEQVNRYDDAIKLLVKSIDIPSMPELGKIYIRCAKLMEKVNRSNEAVELLKKGIATSEMTSLYRIYLSLAELLMKDGKDEDAIYLLKEAITDERIIDQKDIYCLCAELMMKNNQVVEAAALLNKGISSKLIRDPVPLYHKFADIMEKSGNTDAGIKFLKGAITHPDLSLEPSIYLACAKQLFHTTKIDDAINVLKQGLLVPDMKDKDQLYKMCAELLARQGGLDDAIEILEKGIADKSAHNHAYLYKTCSELIVKDGRIEDAIEMLKKGINAPALANKVVLFQSCAKLMNKAGRTQEGIELIEKAIQLPGMTGQVLLYQTGAKMMASISRHNEAIELLYMAFNGPNIGNLVSLYQLCAELMIDTKQHEKAISLLKEGLAHYPKDKNLKLFYEKSK